MRSLCIPVGQSIVDTVLCLATSLRSLTLVALQLFHNLNNTFLFGIIDLLNYRTVKRDLSQLYHASFRLYGLRVIICSRAL